MSQAVQKLIIGISGSSGCMYGVRILEALKTHPIETHLVLSSAAKTTLQYETDLSVDAIYKLADVVHAPDNFAASISSGSFKTLGMIIAPCSMNSLAQIAHGLTENLLTRAASVNLKERRKLVLLPRETPLHATHIENMLKVTQMGGIIAPPVPAFYSRPKSIDDIINETAGRTLALFDIETTLFTPWKGD